MTDRPRILVVDNDVDQLRATSRLLTAADYEVIEAATGVEGLRLAIEEQPDLVLLTEVLPDVEGLEVCRCIKTDAHVGDSYVVLLSSGRNESDGHADGLEAGPDGYMARPLSNRELLAQVQAWLRLKRAEDALRERTQQLDQRVKELNCLYGISRLVENSDLTLDEILQGIVDLIPPAWQYPEVTCARIILKDQEFRTEAFEETAWGQSADIIVHSKPGGRLQVFYLQERPPRDEGPFLKEQRTLISAIAVRLGRIIERKQAEAALRKSEERYRALFELISDLTYAFRVEPDGTLEREWLAGAFEDITGFNPQELAEGGDWARVIHPDDQPASQQHIQTLLAGQPHEYELRIVDRHGQVHWVRDSGWPERDELTGRVIRIYGATRDITERKQVAEALMLSERRYRELLEMLHEGIWAIDQDARTTYVNPRMAEMLGYAVEEMQGRHLFDFMDERGVEICTRNLERREQGIIEQHDFQFQRKDGSRLYALLETTPIFDDDGNYVGGVAGVQDITERVEAEHALRESEEQYRNLVEQISDVIYKVDARGLMTYVSPAIEAFAGYSPSEVVGRPFDNFIACEDLGRMRDNFQQLVSSGKALDPNEYRVVTKSGELRWMRASSQPITQDGQIVGVQGVLTDITERVQAREQLEEAAATAERERLARELHDAVIQSLFSTCLIAETLPRVWERDLEKGRQGLEEISRLTHGALAEMRTLLIELRPAALGEQKLDLLLRQLTRGMMARTRMQVTTTVVGDCSLPGEVRVALYRITQEALNNISKHAQASAATISLRCGQEQAELHISDDGRGFDPSSAQPHQLGLKIMRERARAIGAEFKLGSEPDKGTQITVTWHDTGKADDE